MKDTYSFNVQANYFDFDKSKDNDTANESPAQQNTYEAVVSEDAIKMNANVSDASSKNGTATDAATAGQQPNDPKTKNTIDDPDLSSKVDKKSKRRGVWKRVRVRPVDSFEAAESQNIGKHLYNSLGDSGKEYGDRSNKMDGSDADFPKGPADTFNLLDEFQFDDDAEVQTILPIETTTRPEEYATTVDNEPNEASAPTTEPTDAKDERELEATSTVGYNANDNDNDEPTTVLPPFESIRNEVKVRQDTSSSVHSAGSTADDKAERTDAEPNGDDQPSGSIMDEVKQKLTELFSFDDDDVVVTTTERVFKFNRNFKRPKSTLPLYTAIDRTPLVNDISTSIKDTEKTQIKVKTSPASMKLEPVPVLKTILRPIPEEQKQPPSAFHKDLMDSVIYATSTSTEISHETEICYRGRCVKTQKKP